MEYHQGTSVHIMAVSEIKEKEKGEVYLRRKWLKTSQILGVKKDKETNKAQMTPLAWKIPWTEEAGYSPWGCKKLGTTENPCMV